MSSNRVAHAEAWRSSCVSACLLCLWNRHAHMPRPACRKVRLGRRPARASRPGWCYPHQQQLAHPGRPSPEAPLSLLNSLAWRRMSWTNACCSKAPSFRVIYYVAFPATVENWYKRKFLFVTFLFLHNFLQQFTFDFPMEDNKKIVKLFGYK